MKRMIRALVTAAVLVTAMTCTAFAATEDYTTDINGTVTYDAATEKYSASYSKATDGNQYVLLVAEGTPEAYTITEDSILYIDQTAADGGASFNGFIPKTVTDSVVLLGGSFDGVTSPVVLGTIKSQYVLGDVNEDGEILADDALLALQIAIGSVQDYTPNQFKAANAIADDEILADDALRILQYAIGAIQEW